VRILQVHNRHREAGGEDVVVENERRLLTAHGHEVLADVVENPPTAGRAAAAMLASPWNVVAARRVAETARRFRPDVVHVHNTWFALSPAVFAALGRDRWPTVVTLHNFRTVCANGLLLRDGRVCHTCVGSHPFHAVRYRCYRDSTALSALAALAIATPRAAHTWSRRVHRFFVLDEAARPILVAGGVPDERILIRPNFVDDPGGRRAPPSASRDVVMVGRLSPEKGADVLVEAWARAGPEGLGLTIYGEGEQLDALARRAVPGVRLPGRVHRDDLLGELLGARALVFPSVWQEAGPLVPLEAAGAGLPLLMSSAVGMSARLGDAGWTFAPGDPASLAAALAVLADDDAVDRAGTAARSLYLDRHTPALALEGLVTGYEEAIAAAHLGKR